MISDVKVYGIEDSFKASKYPMATDVSGCNADYTDRIKSLASCEAGTGHNNFLKGIIVEFDLTMTPKMSVELERYHFIDFISSQSTMHRITRFDLDTAYIGYVDKRIIEIIKEKASQYNAMTSAEKAADEGKNLYLEILYSNPCGMYLTAKMVTNYLQLKTIYKQRRHHRLPEWQEFCDWVETLPYAELIVGDSNGK